MAEITKEILVNATLEDTWALVSDMEKFSLCVPGCKEVKKVSETEFDWVMEAKVMRTTRQVKASTKIQEMREPVHASFTGEGRLFEKSNHYKMQINGTTDLEKISNTQTKIIFSGVVQAKGVGGALIDKIAAGQMEPLFKEFQQNIKTTLGDTGEESAQSAPTEATEPEVNEEGAAKWVWIAGAAAVLVVAYIAIF